MNNPEYTPEDVARTFLPGMVWESEHFGYCTIDCNPDHPCSAVFYLDGPLRVFCTNPHCTARERQYSVPASAFKRIADNRNGADDGLPQGLMTAVNGAAHSQSV